MGKIFYLIATGCFSGLFPVSPGTIGSLVAVGCWTITDGSLISTLGGLLLMTLLGFMSARYFLSNTTETDPKQVVIDEWIGMWIALLPLANGGPYTLRELFIAFVLFRLFDILKPWPVSYCESFSGAWGVILDDVAAGALAALALLIL